MFHPRLIALETSEPDCGEHHTGQQQRRDRPQLSGQVTEDFHGTHAKGMLDAAAFMERPDIEPARMHIPHEHRKRSYAKRQHRREALPAEKETTVWPGPAEEQRHANQLDRVDELRKETDTDGRSSNSQERILPVS